MQNRDEKVKAVTSTKFISISKVKHKCTTPNIERNQTTTNIEDEIIEKRQEEIENKKVGRECEFEPTVKHSNFRGSLQNSHQGAVENVNSNPITIGVGWIKIHTPLIR